MKKRLFALILSVVMVAALFTACGSSTAKNEPAPAEQTTAASAAEQTDAAPAEQTEAAPEAETADENSVDTSDWVQLDMSFSTFNADTNIVNYGLEIYFYGRLQDEMPGFVNLESFYNGTLVSQADTLDGVADGIATIGVVDLSAIPGRLPVLDMFNYPGMRSNTANAATGVLYEFITTEDLEELEDVHFLWCHRSGPSMIISTEPVADGSNLSGMQMRASATFAVLTKALGGSVVTMPLSDVYEALRNGMLQGAFSTGPIFSYTKMHEVAPYGIQCPLVSNLALFVMNKDLYESMPDSQREIFDAVVEETQEVFYNNCEQWAEYMPTYYEMLNGMTEVRWMEGEELANAEALAAPLLEEYAQQLNDMGYDGDYYLNKFKELSDKYNEMYPAEDAVKNLEAFKNGELPIIDIKVKAQELLDEARANY